MALPIIGSLIETGMELIGKAIPDPIERKKAEVEFLRVIQTGELEPMRKRYEAIVQEAASADPWTSRARPSFLYVVYFLLLWSIPMGILSAFEPKIAERIIAGQTAYLQAIPGNLYALFGAVMLGYVNKRSGDKSARLGVEQKQGLLSKLLG